MEAADEAAQVPLFPRQVLDGLVDPLHAGVQHRVEIDPGRRHDPEQQEAQRTEMTPGIAARAEHAIEPCFDGLQAGQREKAERFEHVSTVIQ